MTTDRTEPMMTYVVEQQVDHGNWQVVGVRLSLDSAFALGEHAISDTLDYGFAREWKIDWREGTTTTHLLDDDTTLRDWSGHRPRRPKPTHTFIGHEVREETFSETYVGITITEHPAGETP